MPSPIFGVIYELSHLFFSKSGLQFFIVRRHNCRLGCRSDNLCKNQLFGPSTNFFRQDQLS